MKKLLIATTALVMTAGIAAAEVKVSGTARMGIVSSDATGGEVDFSSRARVIFTLSGTTDSGLEFGASFKAHEAGDANNGVNTSVYLSGAFGKIEMGDVTSAPEALFGDLYGVGYTDLQNTTLDDDAFAIPYLTQDDDGDQAILYTYSAGAFSVAAAMGDGKNAAGADVDNEMSIAGAYTFGNYTVGLGYESIDTPAGANPTQVELAGVATFGNTEVKAYYADREDDNSGLLIDDAFGLGVKSAFGATTVTAFYQSFNSEVAANDGDVYGIGAAYDLGGGASVVGGIADGDDAYINETAFDLGLKFTF